MCGVVGGGIFFLFLKLKLRFFARFFLPKSLLSRFASRTLFSAALLALLYLSISDPSIRSASEELHSWGNMFLSSEKTRSAPAELGVMANCTGRRHGGDGAGGSGAVSGV